MSRLPTLIAPLALTWLNACAAVAPQNDWKFGDPPPEPPYFAWRTEGDVRDARTLRPVSGAEITVTTSRSGYERRARTDAAGRFSVGYSGKEHEGDGTGVVFLPGLFTSDQKKTVDEVLLTVTCRGWRPLVVKNPGRTLALSLLPLDEVTDPPLDCPN